MQKNNRRFAIIGHGISAVEAARAFAEMHMIVVNKPINVTEQIRCIEPAQIVEHLFDRPAPTRQERRAQERKKRKGKY